MISAVNGRKRALLTKSALEWPNKRCTAQFTLCVGNKKGKTELKAMCDWYLKKIKFFFFFFLVSRYLGRDTIHVSPAQVSRCIDASMHRYNPSTKAPYYASNELAGEWAHSMESHPKLKKISFQILQWKLVFIIFALLIWYVAKKLWDYNKPLLSSGIWYAPPVTQIIYNINFLYFQSFKLIIEYLAKAQFSVFC